MNEAKELAEQFAMKPHPEGGYYLETFRSGVMIPRKELSSRFQGERASGTAILYLLEKKSLLHRIASDEVWAFHSGSPLHLIELSENGIEETVLGLNLNLGQKPQHTVAAGKWFGAYTERFSLVSCFVSPGFDFAEFEIGKKDALLSKFPEHREIIMRLTPESN